MPHRTVFSLLLLVLSCYCARPATSEVESAATAAADSMDSVEEAHPSGAARENHLSSLLLELSRVIDSQSEQLALLDLRFRNAHSEHEHTEILASMNELKSRTERQIVEIQYQVLLEANMADEARALRKVIEQMDARDPAPAMDERLGTERRPTPEVQREDQL